MLNYHEQRRDTQEQRRKRHFADITICIILVLSAGLTALVIHYICIGLVVLDKTIN